MQNHDLVNTPDLASQKFSMPFYQTLVRVLRYTVVRVIGIFFAVVIGVYLTILVANLGGYVDEVFESMANETILGMLRSGWLKGVEEEQREKLIEETRWQLHEDFGLHKPFILRTFNWLIHGLVLDFGETGYNYLSGLPYAGADEQDIRYLISNGLPFTLALMGGANLVVFVLSVWLALGLSRHFGSLWDRLLIALSPISSAPSWVHGLLLIVIFAGQLRILPFPRQVDILAAENWQDYIPYLLRYMILPFLAIFMSAFFQSVYFWRSYFLIYHGEDYIDLARAKGVPPQVVERRYILRPALPYVITSFALSMVGIWQGSIALEVLFYWQGIGNMFVRAIRWFDTPMVVGIVVTFAYLLALTVLILDIFYAFIDPRVRISATDPRQRSTISFRQRVRLWLKGRTFPSAQAIRQRPRSVPTADRQPSKNSHLAWRRKGRENLWRLVQPTFKEIFRYPSAILGVILVLILVGVSIYTILAVPYTEAVNLWRRSDENAFIENPRTVPPTWVNFFRRDQLPETVIIDTREHPSLKTVTPVTDDMTEITLSFPFSYHYRTFPQDLIIFMAPKYSEKVPLVHFTWTRPDGKEFNLGHFSVPSLNAVYYVTQDSTVKRKLGSSPITDSLFADGIASPGLPITGDYELVMTIFTFEPDSDFEARMVLYGQVHGLSGTDNQRRDLTVALLWGTPVALAFGIVGALLSTFLSMMIAATGVWFGNWLDDLIQRLSDINIILPTLPIAIMVFMMYSKSIWAILGVVVALNIFGNNIKIFRAAFLQLRDTGYIEAARAYGASHRRVITRYLVPRIIPVLVPQLVIMVPGYVFYEATLAFLGISDPYLPTWGKIIYDAITVTGFRSAYYWILQPLALLLVTGIAFAMLGFTLDRILNPRLREQ